MFFFLEIQRYQWNDDSVLKHVGKRCTGVEAGLHGSEPSITPHPLPLACTLSLSRKHCGCTGCKCHEKLSPVIKSFLGVIHFILNEEKFEKNEKNISTLYSLFPYWPRPGNNQQQEPCLHKVFKVCSFFKSFGFVCVCVKVYVFLIPIGDCFGHKNWPWPIVLMKTRGLMQKSANPEVLVKFGDV